MAFPEASQAVGLRVLVRVGWPVLGWLGWGGVVSPGGAVVVGLAVDLVGLRRGRPDEEEVVLAWLEGNAVGREVPASGMQAHAVRAGAERREQGQVRGMPRWLGEWSALPR
jgi:hypothetical protein